MNATDEPAAASETTPIADGWLRVDAAITADEAAALDGMENVERLDQLLGEVEDAIANGLAAIAVNLREKHGDRVQVAFSPKPPAVS